MDATARRTGGLVPDTPATAPAPSSPATAPAPSSTAAGPAPSSTPAAPPAEELFVSILLVAERGGDCVAAAALTRPVSVIANVLHVHAGHREPRTSRVHRVTGPAGADVDGAALARAVADLAGLAAALADLLAGKRRWPESY